MVTEIAYKEAKKITDAYEEQKRRERHERIKNLKSELSDYFAENEVGGVLITDFDLQISTHRIEIVIYSLFEEITYPDDKSIEMVGRIGAGYGEKVGFHPSYYPK